MMQDNNTHKEFVISCKHIHAISTQGPYYYTSKLFDAGAYYISLITWLPLTEWY